MTGRRKALRCSEGETFTANFSFSFGRTFECRSRSLRLFCKCCTWFWGEGAATSANGRLGSPCVAPKTTRSQLCRCSAELLTLDGASLAKTFQSGVLKMTITPYNSYCDVSCLSRGCINYGGTLAPRQRRCYLERKRRPQIRACSEPERRYYPSAFLFFMFVFKV